MAKMMGYDISPGGLQILASCSLAQWLWASYLVLWASVSLSKK